MTKKRLNRAESSSRRRSVVKTVVNTLRRNYDEESEETRLEAEIAAEESPKPKSGLSRFRHKGAHIVHSKPVLMLIVLLNVADCLLVIGELILDIHYIKGILDESDLTSQKFIDQMQTRYPTHLYGHDIDHIESFYSDIYDATCYWDNDVTAICGTGSQRRRLLAASGSDATDGGMNSEKKAKEAHAHSIWEEVSHGMHKASIAILGILCAECFLKIFFMGRKFFHHKIEVFDAIIVVASFIVDLVFLKGLTIYRIQDGILILSFLLPWRVIRVVNSLVVAVLDNENFRIKMIYKQKKKVTNDLQREQDKTRMIKVQLTKLEDFLEKEGMPRWKFVHYTHFDENNVSLASMASYTIRSFMDSFANQTSTGKVENGFGPHNHYSNNNNNLLNVENLHGTSPNGFDNVQKQNLVNLNGSVHPNNGQSKTGGFQSAILENGCKLDPLDPRTNGLLSNMPPKSDNQDKLNGNGVKPSDERTKSRDTVDVSTDQSGEAKEQNGGNQNIGDTGNNNLENSDFTTWL